VEYLYPASQPPKPTDGVTRLKLPLRVGIAFVPAGRLAARGISEAERASMLERVKASFQDRPFISQIEVIPDAYLRPGGGFDNLDQVARMLQVDVVCLLSYDQVQYGEDNPAAILYWTIVGAYVIPATKYSTHTLLDAAVVDVQSRRLLFRAPGVSSIEGHRARLAASEFTRRSQENGFEQALDKLVPALHSELDKFKERAKNDATVQVEHRPGSRGGSLDLLGLGLFVAVVGLYARRR
jgi:rhombotail lipoprotein